MLNKQFVPANYVSMFICQPSCCMMLKVQNQDVLCRKCLKLCNFRVLSQYQLASPGLFFDFGFNLCIMYFNLDLKMVFLSSLTKNMQLLVTDLWLRNINWILGWAYLKSISEFSYQKIQNFLLSVFYYLFLPSFYYFFRPKPLFY